MLELDNGLSFPEAQVRGHEPRTGPYVASASKRDKLNILAPPFCDAAARTCAGGNKYTCGIQQLIRQKLPLMGPVSPPLQFFELVVGRSR